MLALSSARPSAAHFAEEELMQEAVAAVDGAFEVTDVTDVTNATVDRAFELTDVTDVTDVTVDGAFEVRVAQSGAGSCMLVSRRVASRRGA